MGDQEVVGRVVSHIQRFFQSSGPIYCDLDNPTSPHHILWICSQISNVDAIKRSHWMGFLLGVMILHGLVDIEKERAIIQQVLGS